MKVLYVSTLSNTINAFMIPHIELLLNKGHHVDIACNIDREIDPKLIERRCKVFNIEFQRTPLTKQNYTAYKKLKKLIENEKYDIVHTHTPIASTCVRIACRRMKEVKVFYTAHGFHFYKGAPFKNWISYYPIEKWLSKYTDVLITINKEDYERAQNFKVDRVEYIPGVGLDIKKLDKVIVDKIAKRNELGIPINSFLILSVGELNKNKNHKTVIKAMSKINRPDVYYVICGQGPLEAFLKGFIKKLGLEKQVRLLGYRSDIAEICNVSDAFVFPSFREGLSVALMEAMACGLPVICSDIRGNNDLVENEKGGYLVKPSDVDKFANALVKIIDDDKMRENVGKYNLEAVQKFDIFSVNKSIAEIYNDFC